MRSPFRCPVFLFRGIQNEEKKLCLSRLLPVIAALLVLVMFRTVFILGYVPTNSMKPTLEAGSLILGVRIKGSFDVYLIGKWLWILGDTKPIKDSLKALGCKWHSERVCWYWRSDTAKHYGKHSEAGLSGLAAKYGVSAFTSGGETSLAA